MIKLSIFNICTAISKDILKILRISYFRHDWDSYFRDNKNMNEMKAGERPDTIYIQNMPTKWFLDPYDRSGVLKDKPSEFVLKKVFQTFGEIRAVDIPALDPYRYLNYP